MNYYRQLVHFIARKTNHGWYCTADKAMCFFPFWAYPRVNPDEEE